MSDRLPLLRILLISHTVDAILPPMESNRQRDSVSMGKDTKKGFLERRPPGSPEKEHEKWASREPKARPGGPIRVKRRRATLPHPLECSTIAAPGLSYRVRNGTGRLTRAMTTAKPRSRNDSQNTWRPFRPFNYHVAVWEPASGREANAYRLNRIRDHPNAYCRPGRSSTGKTRNQPSTRGSECYVAVAR